MVERSFESIAGNIISHFLIALPSEILVGHGHTVHTGSIIIHHICSSCHMIHAFFSIFPRKLQTRGQPLAIEFPEMVGHASSASEIPSLSVSLADVVFRAFQRRAFAFQATFEATFQAIFHAIFPVTFQTVLAAIVCEFELVAFCAEIFALPRELFARLVLAEINHHCV